MSAFKIVKRCLALTFLIFLSSNTYAQVCGADISVASNQDVTENCPHENTSGYFCSNAVGATDPLHGWCVPSGGNWSTDTRLCIEHRHCEDECTGDQRWNGSTCIPSVVDCAADPTLAGCDDEGTFCPGTAILEDYRTGCDSLEQCDGYWDASNQTCNVCNTDSYYDPSIQQCRPSCTDGEAFNVANQQCQADCPVDSFYIDSLDECAVSCPAGQIVDAVTNTCYEECANHEEFDSFTGQCENVCPIGQIYDYGDDQCVADPSFSCDSHQGYEFDSCTDYCSAGEIYDPVSFNCIVEAQDTSTPSGDTPSTFGSSTSGTPVNDSTAGSGGSGSGGDTGTDPEPETGEASGGGTCSSPPTCTGDSVGCANLIQTWYARCEQEEGNDLLEDINDQLDAAGTVSGGTSCSDPPVCDDNQLQCQAFKHNWRTACENKTLESQLTLSDPDVGTSYANFYNDFQATPLGLAFNNISGLVQGAGTCPLFSIDLTETLIGQVVSTTVHCDLTETIRPIISPVMVVFYTIIGFRIIASA